MNTSAAAIFLLCCAFQFLVVTYGFENKNENEFLQILKRLLLPIQNESRSEVLPNKGDDVSNKPGAVMVEQSNGVEADLNIEKRPELVNRLGNIYNLQCETGSTVGSGHGNRPCSCGERCCTTSMQKRIAGNSIEASSDEFPWHAAIYWKRLDSTWEFICGGTLVNKYVVATAAHCIQSLIFDGGKNYIWKKLRESDQSRLKVKVGSNQQAANSGQQGTGVTDFVVHDQFKTTAGRKALHYDIALLALASPSDRPVVCLHPNPETAFNMENEPDRSFEGCFGIGFGDTDSNKDVGSETLRKVGITILNVTACRDELRSNRLASVTYQEEIGQKELNEEYVYAHMCASTNSKTLVACKWDSGSPIVCPLRKGDPCSPYFLAGIFSYKVGTNCDNTFSVLVNTHHTNEILNNDPPKGWIKGQISTFLQNEGRAAGSCKK